MATITTRAGKGTPLTNAEVDANFDNLNDDKLETAGGVVTGNLGVGGDTTGVVDGTTVTSKFCVKSSGPFPVGGFVFANNTSAGTGSGVFYCRSRGTLASPSIVQNNDRLATLFFAGHDGVDLALAAQIEIEVDGVPGSNDMPTRMIFKTTPAGQQTPAEAIRIGSNQVVTLANALPIASGGTGQTTAGAAINALLPAQTSQSGKYLTTDGTNPSWANVPSPNNGTLTMNVSGTGLSGSATFTANQAGGSTFTVTSNATSVNTNGAIVARDGSGNFSAGTITAALSGNASTATTLQTARTINGVSFNGSANITITAASPQALTIGTGLSGTSYNGSSAVTIAIDSTVATLTGSQVLTNKTVTDSTFFIQDDLDNTKKAQFQVSGVSAGTTRTYTLPNVTAALATVGNLAQTFSGTTTFSAATVTVGTATAGATYGVGTGATTTGNTKTVNLGTSGASGSTTAMNFGSATSGAISTFTFNGTTSVKLPAGTTAQRNGTPTAGMLRFNSETGQFEGYNGTAWGAIGGGGGGGLESTFLLMGC